jgi:hypothetical protein
MAVVVVDSTVAAVVDFTAAAVADSTVVAAVTVAVDTGNLFVG